MRDVETGWRDAARERSQRSARRRATAVLLLVGFAVILAATAAFAVPMLVVD